MAVIVALLFWGAFLEFRPPAEESAATYEEVMESARSAQELAEWYLGRLKITSAIQRQLDELEARRARSPDNAALDDELQRLRQNLLAEYETTHRLWTAKHGELSQDHARAVWEWQRSRRVLLAMALSAVVLAG